MRGPASIGLLLSLASCDSVLGLDERMADAAVPVDVLELDAIDAPMLDLDMDGVPDSVDPCIQAPGDLIGDLDSDGDPNSSDTCPFDGPNGVDPDGDGLGDACDPFPSPTDRSRCLMRFSSPTLNSALWAPRPPELAWSTSPGALVANPPEFGQAIATTIASTSIEGETVTSYDVVFSIDSRNRFGSLTVWVRADPGAESTGDIGCRWINEVIGGPRIAVARGGMLLDEQAFDSPPTVGTKARITARVVTTGAVTDPAQVTCQFTIGSKSARAEASPALPPGRFGLTVDRWLVQVTGIHVIDRAP